MLKFPEKLKTDHMISLSIIMLIFYANYNTIIDMVIGTKVRIIYIMGALCIGLLPYASLGDLKKPKLNWRLFILWGAFIAVIVLDNNRDLHEGTSFFTIRVICALLFVLLAGEGADWMKNIPRYIAVIGFPNVLATLFFFVFRGAYRIMYKIYGFYPTGTEKGRAGYRAGIANHYSQNGTYIVYVCIALVAMTLAERDKKKRKRLMMLSAAAFFGLLLTGKRGHLLFGFCAILGTYFLCSDGKAIVKGLKLAFLGGAGVLAFWGASLFIEPVAKLMSRFATAGTDNESLTRFAMWKLCIDKFKTSPLFGIGWAQFPQQYFENLYLWWYDDKYKFLNAHNVYLQVLCETGIVGLLLYLSIIAVNLLNVIITLMHIKKFSAFMQDHVHVLTVSIAVQIFFIAYCVTGNGLYDYSFYFYMLAATCGWSVTRKVRVQYPFLFTAKKKIKRAEQGE